MLLAVNERLNWIIKSDFAFEKQMAFRSSDTHLPACSPDSLAVLGPLCPRRFPLCCPQDLKTQKAPKPIRYCIKTSINILNLKNKKVQRTFAAATAAPEGSSHYHSNAVFNVLFAAGVLRRDSWFSSSWDGGFTVLWEIKECGVRLQS